MTSQKVGDMTILMSVNELRDRVRELETENEYLRQCGLADVEHAIAADADTKRLDWLLAKGAIDCWPENTICVYETREEIDQDMQHEIASQKRHSHKES